MVILLCGPWPGFCVQLSSNSVCDLFSALVCLVRALGL